MESGQPQVSCSFYCIGWFSLFFMELFLTIVTHLNQGRHGAHEWHNGFCHKTRWNYGDIKHFPCYMSRIKKFHLDLAKGIYGPIASG
jgi:hypothetical protein